VTRTASAHSRPVLWIMRGLPGSGRSESAAAWVAQDPDNRARVNLAGLRAMQGPPVPPADLTGERRLHVMRDAAIMGLLLAGYQVACDDLNLTSRAVEDLARIAARAGAACEIVDFRDVALEACLAANAARPAAEQVPETVITGMHARHVQVADDAVA
jgi:predicted kinase